MSPERFLGVWTLWLEQGEVGGTNRPEVICGSLRSYFPWYPTTLNHNCSKIRQNMSEFLGQGVVHDENN